MGRVADLVRHAATVHDAGGIHCEGRAESETEHGDEACDGFHHFFFLLSNGCLKSILKNVLLSLIFFYCVVMHDTPRKMSFANASTVCDCPFPQISRLVANTHT